LSKVAAIILLWKGPQARVLDLPEDMLVAFFDPHNQ
jgi:hypothetical protein